MFEITVSVHVTQNAGWGCGWSCFLVIRCERKDTSIVLQLLLFLYKLSDNLRVFGR